MKAFRQSVRIGAKGILWSIFVLSISTASGQSGAADSIETADTISNELSSEHVHVPGTRVSLVPPDAYKVSEEYPGMIIERSEGIKGRYGIQVMDLPGGNFESNTKDFNRESLEAKGVTVNEFKRLRINGYKALFADLESGFQSYQLVLGDSTFSVSIMGTVPLYDPEVKKEIKESILSVHYDKEIDINWKELAKFEVDLSGTDLGFSKCASNTFYFSPKGNNADTSRPKGTSLMISQMPPSSKYLNDPAEIPAQAMSKVKDRGADFDILDEGPTKVDGLDAYFVTAEIGSNEKKKKVYIVGTGNQETVMMIQAKVLVGQEKKFRTLKETVEEIEIK